MLVLTRKPHEKLYVGDDVIVTVLSIQGGRVRLGFEAPPHVPVHRQEVLTRLTQHEEAQTPAGDADSHAAYSSRSQS